MMRHDGRRALLRIEQEAGRQVHTDSLVGMQQREQLGLVLEVRTRRIAERIARPAIFLVKEIANMWRVVSGKTKFLTHALVIELGKCFGGLYAQAVQVEVFRVLASFEQLLGFVGSLGPDGDAGHAENVHLSALFFQKEVGDAEVAALFLCLPRKRESERFCWNRVTLFPSFGQVVDDDVVAFTLRAKVAVNDLGLQPSAGNGLFFQVFQDGPVLGLDQTRVIFLRGSLELPLVFEQRRLIDVLEDLAQVEVSGLQYACAPEWRLRDVRRRRNLDARSGRRCAIARCRGRLLKLLDDLRFPDASLALAVRGEIG